MQDGPWGTAFHSLPGGSAEHLLAPSSRWKLCVHGEQHGASPSSGQGPRSPGTGAALCPPRGLRSGWSPPSRERRSREVSPVPALPRCVATTLAGTCRPGARPPESVWGLFAVGRDSGWDRATLHLVSRSRAFVRGAGPCPAWSLPPHARRHCHLLCPHRSCGLQTP